MAALGTVVFVLGLAILFGINAFRHASTEQQTVETPRTPSRYDRAGSGPVPCHGNEADDCIFAPSVDFWPAGSEGATNPVLVRSESAEGKEIGGVITASNQNVITIRTTSGKTFTITYPEDEISWWNQNISSNYDNYQVGIGDTLAITYLEAKAESSNNIQTSQIIRSNFAIKQVSSKADMALPIERYQAN